ncbi:MAG TPA: nucleoside diphosphate kinase regulator [Noviherbaspirillum sp.]|nr:nucleoside diphosphate kinase regulator [Noviherbaspirillum sp.]
MHTAETPRTVVASVLDRMRLVDLLGRLQTGTAAVDLLRRKLAMARLLLPQEMLPDVVTMNTRVMFLDLDTEGEYGLKLTYPEEAAMPGDISVLTPVGAALFGLRVGQDIKWQGRSGRRLGVRVLKIVYQPEADGQYLV